MAKLMSWFGKSPSSSFESSEHKHSIIVHLYHDYETSAEKSVFRYEAGGATYTVEVVCIAVAKYLNIGRSCGCFQAVVEDPTPLPLPGSLTGNPAPPPQWFSRPWVDLLGCQEWDCSWTVSSLWMTSFCYLECDLLWQLKCDPIGFKSVPVWSIESS